MSMNPRNVKPFVYYNIPSWLNRKTVKEYAEKHNITEASARSKLFEKDLDK